MTEDTDLEIERTIQAPAHLIWRAWTEAELLKKWWAPPPCELQKVVIEPFPGGRFDTMMKLPDGSVYDGEGCVLAAEPETRLVFTDALSAGFRPTAKPFFTAEILIKASGTATDYTARVMHKDAADRQRHADMGFYQGWNTCIDQLEALVTSEELV